MSPIEGVIPAALLPVESDQSVHEEGYRDHISHLASFDAIDGILANGHAGESYALTHEERVRVVQLAADAAGDCRVYSGVVGATTDQTVAHARALQEAGADAVMVDPPATPIHGRRAAAVAHYEAVTDALDVPVVLFQVAARADRDFSPELLAELAEIDGIVAIKEGVWDVDRTQEDILALRERGVDTNYLMGNDEHLLPCYALGVDGTVVELAAALPDRIIGLYEAVQAGDLGTAQSIHQQLAPFLDAVYQAPKHDSSIRLKVALERLDRLPTATPKEPARPIPAEERQDIEAAMERSGLL
jgi:4-hydroxy-tetrahydrodipicolinate synthase